MTRQWRKQWVPSKPGDGRRCDGWTGHVSGFGV